MIDATNLAFAEIADIINHLDKDLYNKIPNKFLKMINLKKDRTYKINIDYSRDIHEQILHETKVILGLMYRDYFVSDEEREKLREREQKQIKQEKEKIREKYNPDNLFKNKKLEKNDNEEEPKILVEYKEKTVIQKIFDKIKSLFKRKYLTTTGIENNRNKKNK